jgi:antitoxin YefM
MYIVAVHKEEFMHSVSYTSLRQNMSSIFNEVEQDRVAIQITRKNHKNLILLTEEDYSSINETLYLLSNPVNAAKIAEGIEQVKKRIFVKVNLDDL